MCLLAHTVSTSVHTFSGMGMCVSVSLVVTLCTHNLSTETPQLRDRGLVPQSSKPFASVVRHKRVSQPRRRGLLPGMFSQYSEKTCSKISSAVATGPMEDGYTLMSFVDQSPPCVLGSWPCLFWDYQKGLGLCPAAYTSGGSFWPQPCLVPARTLRPMLVGPCFHTSWLCVQGTSLSSLPPLETGPQV